MSMLQACSLKYWCISNMDQSASKMNTDRMEKQLFQHKGAHLQPEPEWGWGKRKEEVMENSAILTLNTLSSHYCLVRSNSRDKLKSNEECFGTLGKNNQMCHHVLNQNRIFCLFCFYPFVSHFNLNKWVCLLFHYFVCLVLRTQGKETVWWRLKNLLCASSPRSTLREVLWKLLCWGTFSAKLQRVSRASSAAKKHFPEATNLFLFWELPTVHNTAPHSPKTANSRCDLCMCKSPWKSEHGHSEQRGQHTATSSAPRRLETLRTSAEWQPCVWLNPAVAAERTMKCMNKALWGSAGSLIYYTHVKPPMFILCIARIQQRIWFGLTYFISLFFT